MVDQPQGTLTPSIGWTVEHIRTFMRLLQQLENCDMLRKYHTFKLINWTRHVNPDALLEAGNTLFALTDSNYRLDEVWYERGHLNIKVGGIGLEHLCHTPDEMHLALAKALLAYDKVLHAEAPWLDSEWGV